ncbi:MAG: hypothetical protein ACM336_04105 [Acidobacteriota bacterium]
MVDTAWRSWIGILVPAGTIQMPLGFC